MADRPQIQPATFSRRALLRRAAITTGGTALLYVSAPRDAAALTKMTQKVAGYQDTPKGALRCDNCTHFEPAASCKIVDGTIDPAGWCRLYVKKPTT